MLELLVIVALIIVISAACSLTEAVLYSVPPSHVESLVEAGRGSGKVLQRLRRRVDQPITAILSLNTISNTAGATLAGALAAKLFGSTWVGLFSALLTLAILLFAEVIPKTIGVVYSRKLAPFVARPLAALIWLLRPLVVLCTLATRAVAGKGTEEPVSEAELLVMTRMGLRSGVIDKDEAKVIQNILSLENKAARDVMTPRTVLFSLSAEMNISEARRQEQIITHSRIPIYFSNVEEVGGIVYRRDITAADADGRGDLKLESLTKPVHYVQEKTHLDRVLKMFLERREHMFVVIDEYGGLSGVITLEDVIEEILGQEIVDETDQVADLRALAQERRRRVIKQAADSQRDRS
jgi:CBS domain containing-hemolysin-like protein